MPVASLPGPHGIGDLGAVARQTVAWMAQAGQRIWQILPLAVVDGHGCPYASPTAFAREPLYLSLDDLVEDGLLDRAPPQRPVAPVDWPSVADERAPYLRRAGRRIADEVDLTAFIAAEAWVLDWAHFCHLRELHGPFWLDWPAEARDLPLSVDWRRDRDLTSLLPYIGLQWAVDRQWRRIRQLAQAFDIELWGDLPFFVGLDSADVWANRELFEVDGDGRPQAVSGVPPDAFAADGQLWGHPQLDRDAHVADDWSWWRRRVEVAHRSVDVLRIDHFRGIESVWRVPAGADTAVAGAWVPGPGAAPLLALVASGARLVAEDLGIITDDVRALRDDAQLPGMAVLQFAFGPGGESHFLPHAHREHQVVYTGTHDNDTLLGWLSGASPETLEHIRRYFGTNDIGPAVLCAAAMGSVARNVILPMADVLGLPSQARINTPGTLVDNWSWRCGPKAMSDALASRLREEAILFGRRGDA